MKKATIIILALVFTFVFLYPALASTTAYNIWADITYDGGFDIPQSVDVDSSGNVYVIDYKNTVKKLVNGSNSWKDITANGDFSHPGGVAVDNSGNVYVADLDHNKIKKLPNGSNSWTDITGNGDFRPGDVAVNSSGNVYVTDYSTSKIHKQVNGTWTDITGNGGFNGPYDVAVDNSGNVYVVDGNNIKLKKLANGSNSWADITYNGDFSHPKGVAVDNSGNVYVTDTGNNTIKELVNGSSVWTDITGNGNLNPLGVAVDSIGNVYITNSGGGSYILNTKYNLVKKLWRNIGTPSPKVPASDGRGKLKKSIALFIGSPSAYVNDSFNIIDPSNIQVVPVEIDGRTLIPIRFISEKLGAKVQWDPGTGTATITINGKTAKTTLNSNKLTIDNTVMPLDISSQMINERLYLPLRAVVENILGKKIFYDSGLIQISDSQYLLDKNSDKNLISDLICELTAVQGNTSGNLNNFGTFARYGDWIYYCDNQGTYNKCILYKLNVETNERIKLIQGKSIYSLNVIGDWIYYLEEFPDGQFHQSSAIYKIKTDGTEKAKITNSTSEEARYIIINGDWIYYDNWDDDQKLYKIKTDGTNKTKLADITDIHNISVQGNSVYFVQGNGRAIYKVGTDGAGLTKISSLPVWYNSPVVSGDWIYFISTNGIERISIDGLNTETVRRFKSSHAYSDIYLHVNGNYLYFDLSDYDDDNYPNHKIYRINTDGTDEKIVTDVGHILNFCGMWITGDEIFYSYLKKNDGPTQTDKIRIEGTEKSIFALYAL